MNSHPLCLVLRRYLSHQGGMVGWLDRGEGKIKKEQVWGYFDMLDSGSR